MTFLRNLATDLVEKRLWPIAVALLLALVAVPVLLGGGSSAPAPAPAPVVATPTAHAADAGATAQVSLATPAAAPKARHRAGKERNPFAQLHQPKAETASSTAGSAGAASGAKSAAPSASGTAPSTTTITKSLRKSKTGKSPATTPVRIVVSSNAKAARRVYRVGMRFGLTGHVKSLHDPARLAALPSPKAPVVLFLGVRQDGRTAVFVVAPNVEATGDGYCRPRKTNCRTLEMRAGDLEILQAGTHQYALRIASVKRQITSAAAALRRHTRASKSGSKLFRKAAAKHVPGTHSFVFSRRLGVLVPR